MSSTQLDQVLIKKAVHALIQKFSEDARSKPSLFEDDGAIILVQVLWHKISMVIFAVSDTVSVDTTCQIS